MVDLGGLLLDDGDRVKKLGMLDGMSFSGALLLLLLLLLEGASGPVSTYAFVWWRTMKFRSPKR